tara:strand:- start:97 stop:477 length:381 start_codon:yes stop_codon:yes gene_type:complete
MEFIPSVEDAFNKYGVFNGRSSRSQYWWWALFSVLSGFFCNIADFVILDVNLFSVDPNEPTGWFSTLWSLFLFIPGIAVGSRRLHDVNRSGWWQLLYLTVIGIFLLLFWFCKKSDQGENSHGILSN